MKTNVGFTLIEVLIALVILAGGLLGLALLQAASLKNTQNSYYRSQATQFAYDMADRIRANQAGVATYTSILPSAATETKNCEEKPGCSPAAMAENDLKKWYLSLVPQQPPPDPSPQTQINNALLNAEAIVCLDATPTDTPPPTGSAAPKCSNSGSIYAIKIWWDEDRSGNDNKQIFVVSFQL